MLIFILNFIFWTLALYGLLEFIKTIIYSCMNTTLNDKNTYLIVTVKNAENNIEGIVRMILSDIEGYNSKKIFVVDLNSTDNTVEILKKLSRDNTNIKIMSWEKCKSIIDQISLTNS